MTKNVMSSCSTCLGANLPLAANLWSVSLYWFSFIYLFLSVQMRVKRGSTIGNSQSKQTIPNSQADQLASVAKNVFCYSLPDVPLLFRYCWQGSWANGWTRCWTYQYNLGGMNVWVDRAIPTGQSQELSVWGHGFRSKIYYSYPWPCSSVLCKWLRLKVTQNSARSENSWPNGII